MILKKWNQLPPEMQTEAVQMYYKILEKKKVSLILKRLFDIAVASALLVILSPVFLVLIIIIKTDSAGPVFFRQVRVTQCGKIYRIFKFRTMVQNAERLGSQVTVGDDPRITRVGKIIRRYRLDEIGQLFDVLRGTMTFVGTRPEVPRYVEQYTDEMRATLLLPAGVTSAASIAYKDEEKLLSGAICPDEVYVHTVLPEKMKYNLSALKEFNLWSELKLMMQTVLVVTQGSGKSKSDKILATEAKDERHG